MVLLLSSRIFDVTASAEIDWEKPKWVKELGSSFKAKSKELNQIKEQCVRVRKAACYIVVRS